MTFEEFKKQQNPKFSEKLKQFIAGLPEKAITGIPFLVKDITAIGKGALKLMDSLVDDTKNKPKDK